MGDVWSAAVAGDFAGVEYLYEVDGELKTDPCGRQFSRAGAVGGFETSGSAPAGNGLAGAGSV